MRSPVAYALERSSTQAIDLAKELDLSRQYISRACMGMHVNLNPKLLQWLVSSFVNDFHGDFTIVNAAIWYSKFKTAKRLQISIERGVLPASEDGEFIKLSPVARIVIPENVYVARRGHRNEIAATNRRVREKVREDFIEWRKKYWSSTYMFCSDMCLPPSTVDSYENRTVLKMPRELKEFFEWLNS